MLCFFIKSDMYHKLDGTMQCYAALCIRSWYGRPTFSYRIHNTKAEWYVGYKPIVCIIYGRLLGRGESIYSLKKIFMRTPYILWLVLMYKFQINKKLKYYSGGIQFFFIYFWILILVFSQFKHYMYNILNIMNLYLFVKSNIKTVVICNSV